MTAPELVNLAEIGRRLGVSRQRVHQLHRRDASFPRPAMRPGHLILWDWAEVAAWAHATGHRVQAGTV